MIVTEGSAMLDTEYRVIVLRDSEGAGLQGNPMQDNSLVALPGGGTEPEAWVHTGSQWGPFEIVAQFLDSPPSDPDDSWVDIVELTLNSDNGIAVCEMVDGPVATLAGAGGRYRVRVSAKGRREGLSRDDAGDYDFDDVPIVEHYLLQAWPALDEEPRVLRGAAALTSGSNEPSQVIEPDRGAALAATAEIGRALQRGSQGAGLSGKLGQLTVERMMRGRQRQLFEDCYCLLGWWLPDWDRSWNGQLAIGGVQSYATLLGEEGLTGGIGHIRVETIGLKRPTFIEQNVTWYIPEPGEPRTHLRGGDGRPFLTHPSVLRIDLNKTTYRADDDSPLVAVKLCQRDLPIEWAEPMRQWWEAQLSAVQLANQV